ncbi:uncharacterized protein (TIGR02596 family) [Roseimicrobium gellanilyticum]|uniref:Uncharacterized protein (TIGR02596 family) n=1 Tax=Roseimicrobium gellanilyticum TaxID=748857 RepID=A0A366HAE1_9BACT|nr:Verru_Chthon cassette protein D [Roseimicrobium gellanilyticum]RBP39136.1 uncharacterized protein (TIGR02596 family) [Roseimicrobium gellanilyticum]
MKNIFRVRPAAGAFTLVEMLLVITIVALLLGLAGSSLSGTLQSQTLAATARQLGGDLEFAALLARKENRPVDILFYKFKPGDDLGEHAYRGYQFGVLEGFNDKGVPEYRFLTEPKRFSRGVILSPRPEHSTLLALPEKPVSMPGAGVPETSSYISYQIRPDGTTTLDPKQKHAVTLVMETDLEKGDLPPDFRTILINPVTARARVY